jgi:SAM-dependent methyltransferase
MKLKKPLPKNRSLGQIVNHYKVEKSIAERIKKANSQEERTQIYVRMYDELFSQVPDHPRLTQRENEESTLIANKNKFSLLLGFINKSSIIVEFGSGDCRFAMEELASHVAFVYGIDISDQRKPCHHEKDNFKLILYNGYSLNDIKENSVDIVFSDQLVEHFHPKETMSHFKLVHQILKKGGKYIFRTPHALSGPHDISGYFSDEPEGFHFKEWTYIEIEQIIDEIGYSGLFEYWAAKSIRVRLPNLYFTTCENLLSLFPKRYIRCISKYLLPNILCAAVK